MNPPIIVHRKDVKPVRLTPGTQVWRILTTDTVNSEKLYIGIGESEPETSPHPWHRHDRESLPKHDYIYPKGFVEFYYILNGSAKTQWKTPDGKVHEEPVSEGDTVFFPEDVMEHQVLNTGNGTLTILAGMVPHVKIIDKT